MNKGIKYMEADAKTDDGLFWWKELSDENYKPIYSEYNYHFEEIIFSI